LMILVYPCIKWTSWIRRKLNSFHYLVIHNKGWSPIPCIFFNRILN
jgi:hypothetical protein